MTDHEHEWAYDRTFEEFWIEEPDSAPADRYVCTADGCDARKYHIRFGEPV